MLREGGDVTLVGYGVMINETLRAADLLEAAGVSAEVIKLGRLRPNGFAAVRASVNKTRRLIVAEDVCDFGSLGRQILSTLACGTEAFSARLLNLGEGIVPHGSVEELRRACGIDAEAIAASAKELCGKN